MTAVHAPINTGSWGSNSPTPTPTPIGGSTWGSSATAAARAPMPAPTAPVQPKFGVPPSMTPPQHPHFQPQHAQYPPL